MTKSSPPVTVSKSFNLKLRYPLTLSILFMLHLVNSPLHMFSLYNNVTSHISIIPVGHHKKIAFSTTVASNVTFFRHITYTSFCVIAYAWLHIFLAKCGDIEPNPGPLNSNTSQSSLSLLNSLNTSRSLDFSLGLSIIHYNVQSLRPKLDLLTAELLNFDILLFTETWLNDSVSSDEICINTFQCPERKDRSDGYGGVALYVKDSVHYRRRRDLETQGIECIWIETCQRYKKLLIGLFYRPPSSDNIYIQSIENSMSLAVDSNIKEILIMGDFNYNMLESSGRNKIESLCRQFSLSQLINEPTHYTEHSSSLLDLVLSSTETNIIHSGVADPFLNQETRFHCPVFALYRFVKPTSRSFVREIWKYNECNYRLLHEMASSVDWSALSSEDVNEYALNVTNVLLEIVGQSIPCKSVTIRPSQPPWFSNIIRYKIRVRKRLYRKAKQTQTQYHWTRFKVIRNEVVNLIRESKKAYYDKLANKLTSNIRSKDWWRILKDFIKSDSDHHTCPPILIDNDIAISDNREKANLLNSFFSSQANIDDSNVYRQQLAIPSVVMHNILITPDEVNSILKSLPQGKASGPDGVDNRILRELSDELSQPLSDLFNLSLSQGTVPNIWKEAHVCAVFKGGDRSCVGNYRPISLLSNLNKVMEKLLFKHLFNFFRESNTLTPCQSGFVPGDSTTNQLTYLYNTFIEALDHGKEIRVVFFDIRKAFDRVWHTGLLDKLKSYGISPQLHLWLESYLTHRRQRVVLPGVRSDWMEVKAGVPQGSILGPLLFIIYINDIVAGLNSNIRLFADDTSLSMVIENPITDAQKINDDITTITEWAERWLVTFNPSKTESLLISRKTSRPFHPDLIITGQTINQVSRHKHLGLVFSENGSWTNHIEHILNKAWKRINIMRKLKFLLDRKSLEIIYLSFIRPILEYGDIVWCNINTNEISEINKIQHEAARIATGATKLVSIDLLTKEVGWESLESRRRTHKLVLFYKMKNGLTPTYLSSLVPPVVGQRSQYPLRNSPDVETLPARTQLYYNSFLPSVIRDWNTLSTTVRSAQSVYSFKTQLKNRNINTPRHFYTGKRRAQIFHCRLRLKCSSLNHHLFSKNIIDSPHCRCGAIENTSHFFLFCPLYDDLRRNLYRSLPQDFPPSTNLFLNGDINASFDVNIMVVEAVHDFILGTKRFDT